MKQHQEHRRVYKTSRSTDRLYFCVQHESGFTATISGQRLSARSWQLCWTPPLAGYWRIAVMTEPGVQVRRAGLVDALRRAATWLLG